MLLRDLSDCFALPRGDAAGQEPPARRCATCQRHGRSPAQERVVNFRPGSSHGMRETTWHTGERGGYASASRAGGGRGNFVGHGLCQFLSVWRPRGTPCPEYVSF